MEYQEHFGRKFYLDKEKGYWISTDYPRIRAHRWVWINIHGPIPKGYHIHHKDKNKSNNAIENLELILWKDHLTLHMSETERKEYSRNLANKIRHMTVEWHRSEEGRAWHRYHALKCGFGKWEKAKYQCQHCGKEYESTKRSRVYFCSNACKSASRRESGKDDETRKCFVCNTEFVCNKYAKRRFCSRKCSYKIC